MIRILQKNNRITKILFSVIIGAAIVSMCVYLIPGLMDNSSALNSGDVYATVQSPGLLGRFETPTSVKTAEVGQLAQRMLKQQRLPDFLLSYMLTRAGQMLVQQQVLVREADKLGLQVSNDDLAHELQHGPLSQYLFPKGQYIGDDAYMNFVQENFNLSRSEFESRIKLEMEITRLENLVTGGVTVGDAEVRSEYRKQSTKVKFSYVSIASDDVSKGITATDAELEAFFNQNKARYASAVPEARKLEYAAFDASSLPGGRPKVGADEVQQYYSAHAEQYQVKDRVRVRHILVAVKNDADAATDTAAKQKAEGLLKQIKAGGDFADLAKKNSDDPGSKVQGGELGWLEHGTTVPEFDKTAFSLPVGQTSSVIKTEFGYHILQVEEKQTAHARPLAEVKDEIVPILEQKKAGEAESQYAGTLAAEAKKNGLEKTAAAHGLRVVTTDYLGHDGMVPGVADSSGMLTAVFAAKPGDAPQQASTGDGYAIFQLVDIRAAHAPEFAAWKSHVLDDYRQEKTPQLLATKLNQLADRATALKDLGKAAKEMKLELKTSDMVGRDGQVPGVGAMSGQVSVAFDMKKGDISKGINTGQNGVVLAIVDKQEPTDADVTANFDKTREQILGQKRDEMFGVYAGSLLEKYEKAGAVKYSKRAKQTPSPFGS